MAKNAIGYLKDQHSEAREHLDALVATTSRGVKRRTLLLAQLERELLHHMQLEEEIFYPAFKEAVERRKDKTLIYEAKEEHNVAKKVLHDLARSDVASLAFGGKVKVLRELVDHHIKDEEAEMFPIAQKLFSAEELDDLGERMVSRKAQLETGRSWDRSDIAKSASL